LRTALEKLALSLYYPVLYVLTSPLLTTVLLLFRNSSPFTPTLLYIGRNIFQIFKPDWLNPTARWTALISVIDPKLANK
jgi:hypothetical protein